MTAIDMHSHFYGGLVDSLRDRRERPFVAPDAQGRDVLHAMTADTVMAPGYVDPAARLAWMDGAGIATQLTEGAGDQRIEGGGAFWPAGLDGTLLHRQERPAV